MGDPTYPSIVVIRAARTAAVSGALALASSYLERTTRLWPYYERESWIEDTELAFEILTVTAEVALGSKTASRHIAHVSVVFRRANGEDPLSFSI